MKLERLFLLVAATPFIGSPTHPTPEQSVCETQIPPALSLTNTLNSEPSALPENMQTIRILSMNIQNMPLAEWTKNSNYRDDRMDCLGELADRYDVVAFQEDFQARSPFPRTMIRLRPARDPNNMLLSNSSGLTFLSRLPSTNTLFNAYSQCGWRSGDCIARKGVLSTVIEGITIVTTHMDAGRSESDHNVRLTQLSELSSFLPQSGPLLVMGDFNLNYEETSSLNAFLEANNLTLQIRHNAIKGVDIVASRDIVVSNTGYIPQGNLSDHDGLIYTAYIPLRR